MEHGQDPHALWRLHFVDDMIFDDEEQCYMPVDWRTGNSPYYDLLWPVTLSSLSMLAAKACCLIRPAKDLRRKKKTSPAELVETHDFAFLQSPVARGYSEPTGRARARTGGGGGPPPRHV